MSAPTLAPDLTAGERREVLFGLRDRMRRDWRLDARPEQLPPDHSWTTLFLRGGRGSGKTWAGAHILAELIRNDPNSSSGEWAVVAPTYGDARDKCIESEESGLLMALGTTKREVDAGISATVATWNRSIGELVMRDGTKVYIDGADDGAYRIQGYNLRGAWSDEVGLWRRWKDAWSESLGFALRKGEAKRVATGTPKANQPARALVRQLLDDPNVVSRRLRTEDNLDNLSAVFRQEVSRFAGTRLAAQELEGDLLEDVEGALWRQVWLDEERVSEPYHALTRKVLGVDPSDGSTGAEHGWALCAKGGDHRLYVLRSGGERTHPAQFAREMVRMAAKEGAEVVVEKNYGGNWMKDVFASVQRDIGVTVPVRSVHASVGKRLRAEPIAALFEQGRVSMVGEHAELEASMTQFTGAPGERSPDILDAAVHALAALSGGDAFSSGEAVQWSGGGVQWR